MKLKNFTLLLVIVPLAFIVFVIIESCRHETVGKDSIRTIYFDKEVLPIFQSNCAMSGCHNGGEQFDLSGYDAIMKHVTKGDAAGSNVYSAITSVWLNPMPPQKPLNEYQRTLIRLWIEQGAQNNKAPVIVDTTGNDTIKVSYKACFSRDILPVLTSNCAMSGCHDNTTQQGDIIISNYTNIKQLVRAGNPGSSKLYQVINASGEDMMPPTGRLPKAVIDSINVWIKAGALNEDCPSICDTTVFTYSVAVKPFIDLRCKSCHNSTTANGKINLDNYNSTVAVANSGKLVKVLKANTMPPNGTVDDCTKTTIEKWVSAGTKNN